MFDPQAFRDALGSFVTGVTIVTARVHFSIYARAMIKLVGLVYR